MDIRIEEQLKDWRERAWIAQVAHYAAASEFGWWHMVVSSVCLVLAAVTSVLITSLDGSSERMKWVVVSASVLNGLCAQAMALWAFRSRSVEHRKSAVKFSHMKRRIEYELALGNGGVGEFLVGMIKEFDDVTSTSPTVPTKVFRAAEERVKKG